MLNQQHHPLVIDIAAGLGEAADILETHQIKVVREDLSLNALQNSRSMRNRVCSNSRYQPFFEIFDAAHCKDAIEHFDHENKLVFFKEAYRILKPGGELLIVSATQPLLFGYFSYMRGHLHYSFVINRSQYLDKVIRLSYDPRVSLIYPPHFPTTTRGLQKAAQYCGFEVIKRPTWHSLEPDWYDAGSKRIVLSLIKPQSVVYSQAP